MMRYYKATKDGAVASIGTTPYRITQGSAMGIDIAEITEDEYNALRTSIREKAALAEKLYQGQIAEDELPDGVRDEVLRRVEKRREADAARNEQAISGAELARLFEEVL